MSENDLFLPLEASSYHYAMDGPSLNLDPMTSWLAESQLSHSPRRIAEWKLGRYCALRACEKLGLTLKGLPSNDDRSPRWPPGIVGSISHSNGYAIALVSDKARSVGVDIEGIIEEQRLEKIQESFMRDEEAKLLAPKDLLGATLCFSAKETLYKAIRPLCGEYFGFHDARVLEVDSSNFVIELMSKQKNVRPFNARYKGGHKLYQNLVITWLELV